MLGSGRRRPEAATVEDLDEDTQTVLPGSKTSAYVAVKRTPPSEGDSCGRPLKKNHEGSDSGYSSKATTVSSMPSQRRKASDLTVDTAFIERDRKPYSYTGNLSQPERSSPLPPKDSTPAAAPPPSKSRFCHDKGKCYTCDTYGYHKSKDPRSANVIPQSPSKPVREVVANAREDDNTVRPSARRRSSVQDRPSTWYAPGQVVPQPQYIPHVVLSPTMEASPYPNVAYANHGYQYTPITTPISPYPPEHFYYPPTPVYQEFHPPVVRRHSSRARQEPVHEQRGSNSARSHDIAYIQEKQPARVSQRLSKTEQDKIDMPPPAKPPAETVVNGRPYSDRSQSYHSASSSRKLSQVQDYEETRRTPISVVSKENPSHPPSAWKGAERPPAPSKSRSYSQGTSSAENAEIARQQLVPRRTTTSSVPYEHKAAEAEAYQRERGSGTTNILSTENLKKHVSRNSGQRSDAGSTTSRRSHHSSSRESSGRTRGSKTNININGLQVSIPENYTETQPAVTMSIGAVTLSMGTKDRDGSTTSREPKRIERAPSNASKASRRSIASGSGIGSGAARRDRDDGYAAETSRRPSYVDDYAREALRNSAKSSRQHSRAGSSARGSVDYSRRDVNLPRGSPEYDQHRS